MQVNCKVRLKMAGRIKITNIRLYYYYYFKFILTKIKDGHKIRIRLSFGNDVFNFQKRTFLQSVFIFMRSRHIFTLNIIYLNLVNSFIVLKIRIFICKQRK